MHSRGRPRPHSHADHETSGGGGHGGASSRWLVSYADFITLMFVVFLVLFSMARIDASKYGSLAKSLRQTMGQVGPDITLLPSRGEGGEGAPVVPPERPAILNTVPIPPQDVSAPAVEPDSQPAEATPPTPAAPAVPPTPIDRLTDLAEAMESLPGARSGILAVSLVDRGIVLSVAGSVLFAPGMATLKPSAKSYLDEIAGSLVGVLYPIMVEGTADDEPVNVPQALSPWDLTALRAGAVVHYLVDKGFPGAQFVTIGYGGGQSSVDSIHRVNIVIMRKALVQ